MRTSMKNTIVLLGPFDELDRRQASRQFIAGCKATDQQ
jgi:hypothetical protein